MSNLPGSSQAQAPLSGSSRGRLLFAVLLLLARSPLSAEDAKAAALRAKVTLAVVTRFAPEVHFHPDESFFPSSAENLFKGAKRYRVADTHSTTRIDETPIQNPDEIAGLKGDWRIAFDPANAFVKAGERSEFKVTAPVYYSVRIPPDASYVLICYRFLFGFNGPQSMRCHDGVQNFNYSMATMAEHEGDWEGCDVKLTPDLSSLICVTTEAHGDRRDWAPEDMDLAEGTHPWLDAACNSHGIYNPKGMKHDWIDQENLKVVSVADVIANAGGPVWQPWKLPKGLRQFGKVDDRPVGELWAQYGGRMGTYKRNAPTQALRLDGKPLPNLQRVAAGSHTSIFNMVKGRMKEDLFHGMPCGGPGGRDENNGTAPSMPALETRYACRIFSRTGNNMVLGTDPKGGICLRKLDASADNQIWYFQDAGGGAFQIINKMSGQALRANKAQGKPADMANRLILSSHTTWTLPGFKLGVNADNVALRPQGDHRQNLNAFGNGPFKEFHAVGTWDWSKGQPNETWKIEFLK